MKDFGLFSERDAASAARTLARLARFAQRRDAVISTIDLDSLDRATAFNILETSANLTETLHFGPIFVDHLQEMEDQRAQIAAALPQAA